MSILWVEHKMFILFDMKIMQTTPSSDTEKVGENQQPCTSEGYVCFRVTN